MNIQDSNNKIKNIKLKILQHRYYYLSDIILKIQKHSEYLYNNYFIDFITKNHILNEVFIVSKNLNSSYNNYIIETLF